MNQVIAESMLKSYLQSRGVKYFSAKELLYFGASHSDPASRAFGLNTLPPSPLIPKIAEVAARADLLRVLFRAPLRVVSVYRSESYNAALAGAAKSSLHRQGRAIDLAPLHGGVAGLHRVAGEAYRRGLMPGGIGFYDWGVHVDIGPRRTWGESLAPLK